MGKHGPHGLWRKGDAAFGRRHSGVGDVKEDCATSAPDALGNVEVEHHDRIVEPVVAAHPLRTGSVWQSHGPVIGGVRWRVAPAVRGVDGGQRQGRGRHHAPAVAARGTAQHTVATQGRGAVALALPPCRARTAECAGNGERPEPQDPARGRERRSAHDDGRAVPGHAFGPVRACAARPSTTSPTTRHAPHASLAPRHPLGNAAGGGPREGHICGRETMRPARGRTK